jgi:hypothetical protein
VVDDEVFNVMAFKLMLKRFTKIVVDEAYDGNSAINMVIKPSNDLRSTKRKLRTNFTDAFSWI